MQRLRLPARPAVPRGLGSGSAHRVRGDDRERRDRRGRRGVGSGDTMAGFEQYRAPVRRSRPARARDPCPDARDDRLSRRPLLAARGGALGPRRAGARRLAWRRCSAAAWSGFSRTRRWASCAHRTRGPRTPCADRGGVSRGQGPDRSRPARSRASRSWPRSGRPSATALEIMVDLNQWWRMAGDIAPGLGPADVRELLDRLDELSVLWVEEPLAGGDLSGMRLLRATRTGGVRIAGGEMARTFEELRLALELDVARRLSTRCRARARDLGRPHARRSGAAAQSLVHPPHVDERARPARQPPRLLRRRRGSVHRVPLRPSRVDPGAPRLHARPAAADRGRRFSGAPGRAPAWAPSSTRRRSRSTPRRSAHHDAGRRSWASVTWASRCAAT